MDVLWNRSTRDGAILATFYESWARRGELLEVRLKHVTFDEKGAILNIQRGKTGNHRIRLDLAFPYLRQCAESWHRDALGSILWYFLLVLFY